MAVPAWAPHMLYLVDDEDLDTGRPWSEFPVTDRDVLYVRSDLAGVERSEVVPRATRTPPEVPMGSDAPSPRPSGHWSATEEAQARYQIAAMTGRTVDEVTEPLSRLLHELRYRFEATHLAVHACDRCGKCCCTYKGRGSPLDGHTVPMPCAHTDEECSCGGYMEPFPLPHDPEPA